MKYNFLLEFSGCMCSAGLTAFESPATNSGTFKDVYPKKKSKKKVIKNKETTVKK